MQADPAERTALPTPVGRFDVEQVVLRAGDRAQLAGGSFSCELGNYLGIMGPNGSRKTTLAKVIVGALQADLAPRPLGVCLSAGQAQRVALARAPYGFPCLLVLDEPSAFLDSGGKGCLVSAIEAARDRSATMLVIAHRKAIFDDADRLLVLDGGRPKMIGATDDVVIRVSPDSAARSSCSQRHDHSSGRGRPFRVGRPPLQKSERQNR